MRFELRFVFIYFLTESLTCTWSRSINIDPERGQGFSYPRLVFLPNSSRMSGTELVCFTLNHASLRQQVYNLVIVGRSFI